MKLRLRDHRLRLRLTRGEVAELAAERPLRSATPLLGASFAYELVPDRVHSQIRATLRIDDRCSPADRNGPCAVLSVSCPSESLKAWALGSDVGLYASVEAAPGALGEPLEIAIERDFACLKPREGEDDADNFPNPLAPSTTA